jgi:chromosome partitioning protein
VLAGRKNKGANAYRELAGALLKHWKSGKALENFSPDV